MQEKECKQCKQRGVSTKQLGIAILGFYVLFSSIYGTVELVKHLIQLVK